MKRRNAWTLCLTALLLASCASGSSKQVETITVVVTPDLFDYSAEFQDAAGRELTAAPPCPRDRIDGGCSAVNRLIDDYGTVRDQIRAARR